MEAIMWVKKEKAGFVTVVVVNPESWAWTRTSAFPRQLQESVDAAARRVGCSSAPKVRL